jgi:protein-disulfide isomerase
MKLRVWQVLALIAAGVAVGWLLPRLTPAAAGEAGNDEVVALVGSAKLTRDEVERRAPQQFLELARQRFDLTEQYLDRAIQIKLVETEAEMRGLSPAELVRTEVDDQLAEPTDEEVEAFYDERRLESKGTREELAQQIREYLTQQARNERYTAFVTEIGERHSVERLLEPPRTEVEADGFPAKGPAGAPVTIVEFADFQCPYCTHLIRPLNQIQQAYGDQVRMVYRQFPLTAIHPEAQKAAEASLCARAQGKFWEMHDAMFADQQALGVDGLKQSALSLGLDRERFDGCLDSGEYVSEVDSDLQAGRSLGITGTPALFINGRFLSGLQQFDDMARIIDDELRRAGVDFEPEPLRTEVAADGFPAKGPEDAPVTIVEFADFQCPYCGQLLGTLERVWETYGDQVRFVYRQYPLNNIHPEAQKAAEASLCAHDQGKFWEMHDAMLEDQQALGVDDLRRTADSLGLDRERFDDCLDSDTYVNAIAADFQAGRAAGVTGTPTLFINGRFVSGVPRFETLAGIIDDEIHRASQ